MITITYEEPLEQLRLAIEAAGLNAYVGVLPPAEGVSLVMTGGAVMHDLAGNVLVRMQITVNVKARGQAEASEMLGAAQAAFHRLTYRGDNWQITGATMQSSAVQVASDPQGWFLFSSTATARVAYWQHDPPAEDTETEEAQGNDTDND